MRSISNQKIMPKKADVVETARGSGILHEIESKMVHTLHFVAVAGTEGEGTVPDQCHNRKTVGTTEGGAFFAPNHMDTN